MGIESKNNNIPLAELIRRMNKERMKKEQVKKIGSSNLPIGEKFKKRRSASKSKAKTPSKKEIKVPTNVYKNVYNLTVLDVEFLNTLDVKTRNQYLSSGCFRKKKPGRIPAHLKINKELCKRIDAEKKKYKKNDERALRNAKKKGIGLRIKPPPQWYFNAINKYKTPPKKASVPKELKAKKPTPVKKLSVVKQPKMKDGVMTLNADDYKFIKYISTDTAQGSVALFQHKNPPVGVDVVREVVVKFPNQGSLNEMKREIKIYKHLMKKLPEKCRKYFPTFYDVKGTLKGKTNFMALEVIKGKDLSRVISKLSPSVSANKDMKSRIISKVQRAIKCMFKAGVVHGDLHASNIMISNPDVPSMMKIKIIDFGTASIFEPLTRENGMNVWFANKHMKMRREHMREGGVAPSNPNLVWFGHKKPFYATHHMKWISSLLTGSEIYNREPYTSPTNIRKLAGLMFIDGYDTKSINELRKKVYSFSTNELYSIVRRHIPRNYDNLSNIRIKTDLYKKLLDL